MKKDIGFRFSEETHAQLLDLSKKWGCTRTEVIEALVREAVRAVESEEDSLSRKVEPTSGASCVPQQVHIHKEPKVLPKDPKEVEDFVTAAATVKCREVSRTIKPPAKRGTVEPKKLSEAIKDTRTQQERMDDFYRSNMAKGKK